MEEEILTSGTKHETKLIVVEDPEGNRWLCEENIDPKRNLAEQGCWQCGDEHFAFTRDD